MFPAYSVTKTGKKCSDFMKDYIKKNDDARNFLAKNATGKRFVSVCVLLLGMLFVLASCSGQERVKVRDLDALVLSEEVLPEELKEIIDGKKAQPFQLTFSDREYLYICIGYGKQETAGYSVVLDELYLSEAAVYVSTTLLGPDVKDQAKKMATYPYIVIRTELLEQPVIFE